jgi:hypothetical protein
MTISREAVELGHRDSLRKGIGTGPCYFGFSYIRISQHEEALNCLDKSMNYLLP